MSGIKNVVVSTQHAADADNATIRSFITEEIIKPSLPADLLSANTEYLINPTGRFVVGGPGRRLRFDRAKNYRRYLWRLG